MKLEKQGPGKGYICPDDPGEPIYNAPRGSVSDSECEILKKYAKGKRVLEIGTGLGVSTRSMAKVAEIVYTVDIDQWVWDNVWPDLPNNVVCLKDAGECPGVDVVFIDGCHEQKYVVEDLKLAKLKTVQGGAILLHDLNRADIYRLWERQEHRKRYNTMYGIGVIYVR